MTLFSDGVCATMTGTLIQRSEDARMAVRKAICPECDTELALSQQPAPGQQIRCPQCQHELQLDEEPRSRGGSRNRRKFWLTVGGGMVLLGLILSIILVVIGVGSKDPTSATSMNDGSRITIYNPRFRRNAHGKMVMHVDYKFNRGSPDRSRSFMYTVKYEGDQADGWQAAGRDFVPFWSLPPEGTFRIGLFRPLKDRTSDVRISLYREGIRVSNYLPVTIPKSGADLPNQETTASQSRRVPLLACPAVR